jgi:hypothetical protein
LVTTRDDGRVVGEVASEAGQRGRGDSCRLHAPQTSVVLRIHDAREGLRRSGVDRDALGAVENLHLLVGHGHLDVIAHEAMRDAIPDRIDVDERVEGDAPT